MIKRLPLGFALLFSIIISKTEAQNLAASFIPDSLKEKAHCVVREFSETLELSSVNSGTSKIRKVITVLDPNGDEDAILRIGFNKDAKVQIQQINIYDKMGKKIRKVKQSEIVDVPAFDGVSLYSDHRLYGFKPNYGDYPYTVEYEYEIRRENMIAYAAFSPYEGYDCSVERAHLSFVHPESIAFRKKELHLTTPSVVTSKNGVVTESWDFKMIKALESEPYSVDTQEFIPLIYLMPVQLAYDKHVGSAQNWTEYGKWMADLYQGRDELAPAEKAKVNELVASIPDTLQRIKKLYEYMQNRTRYVSIQLGIGGYQPFPATSVFETGYGDCKALTNYMGALLHQINVAAYPALVSSGEYIEPIFKDFPNFVQFDHVILCVPQRKDTLWLECTNQEIPFGFLGNFTDDRDVLLITPKGGQFAHTTRYEPMQNLRATHALFELDPDGNANCTIESRYSGLQYDQLIALLTATKEEQRKWILRHSDLPSVQLNSFSVTNDKQRVPVVTVKEESLTRNYGSFTGNYMLVPLNMVNGQSAIQKMVKERTTDFIVERDMVDQDTLEYQIPAGYKIDFLPPAKTLRTPYGEYTNSLKVADRKMIFTRRFRINRGVYKAGSYLDFYNFILSVSKADNVKAMLIKATT